MKVAIVKETWRLGESEEHEGTNMAARLNINELLDFKELL